MYNVSSNPVFTYAGAMKPAHKADKRMRKVLMLVAAAFLVAAVTL